MGDSAVHESLGILWVSTSGSPGRGLSLLMDVVRASLDVTLHLRRLLLLPVSCCVITFSGCTPSSVPSVATPVASVSASPSPATSAEETPTSTPTPSAATPTATAQPETGKAAAAAFKTWVKQYNAEQWGRHYKTLVSAQQKLISAKKYAACRDKSVSPTFKWVKTVKTRPNVKTKIPGTSKKAPATVVTARLRVSGFTLPIDAHMFYEDGAWRWSMTKENLAGCKK